MDSRNVNKWKLIVDDSGNKNCITKIRMTLRGFKDSNAVTLETLIFFDQMRNMDLYGCQAIFVKVMNVKPEVTIVC